MVQTISHYQILEKLGEGGMGVVYRARDTHLDRSVAIKVLPPERVADPERKRRFVQEARAASALNHPNIVTIYDIDQAGGVDFIAMEQVEGKTLDQLVGRKGLPLNQVLRQAVQIADALAKSHAKGIIHRDLKPTNIMVTGDGLVKILDFGLAKLTEPAAASEAAATRTLEAGEAPVTEGGQIVGTVAYMSPEQAQGQKVDARSDIFSFGAVLYEMIAGRRAFAGETRLSTLAAVLREEPKPLREAAPEVPRELERIVAFCLRKDPDRRLQHMEDLKVQLEALKEESDSGALFAAPVEARPAKKRRRFAIAGLAALILFAAVAGSLWLRRERAQPQRQPTFSLLTDLPGPEVFPSLSPDGKSFVYAGRAAGNWDIYLQRVGGKTVINLTRDSPGDDTQPAFSPDGERIAFSSNREGGGIFLMGALGESVKRLTDFGFNPAWSPDGRRIVFATESIYNPETRYATSQLWIVDVATGEKRILSKGDAVQPAWSPHGQRIAYWATREGTGIFTLPADASPPEKPVALVSPERGGLHWNPVWAPDGMYLYYSSDRGGTMNLSRVPVDEQSGTALGPPEPVTTPSPYSGHLSFSRDGRRLAYAHHVRNRNIESVAFDPSTGKAVGAVVPITRGSRMATCPDVSPDGRWLVFHTHGQPEDLFVIGTDGTGLRQLTDDPHRDREPRWSPDGKRIAFFSSRSGKMEIWMIHPDGSGLQQFSYSPAPAVFNPVWSPDGRQLAFSDRDRTYIAEVDKPWKEQTVKTLPSGFVAWSWSPNGQKLVGGKSIGYSGGFGVYRLDSGNWAWLTPTGALPTWLRDSRTLLFEENDTLRLMDSQSRRVHEVLSAAPNSIGNFSISKDNRRIYFGLSVPEADIWLMSLE